MCVCICILILRWHMCNDVATIMAYGVAVVAPKRYMCSRDWIFTHVRRHLVFRCIHTCTVQSLGVCLECASVCMRALIYIHTGMFVNVVCMFIPVIGPSKCIETYSNLQDN
jgi:hypothetical protein